MLVAVFLLIGGLFRIVTGLAGGVPGSGWVALHGVIGVLLSGPSSPTSQKPASMCSA